MDDHKLHVYIAGPLFSSGRFTDNIRRAYEAAELLRAGGLVPFIPHLHSFLDIHSPREEEHWLELDKDWLLRSDVMYRLTGDSRGADLEEKWCGEADIPVYKENDDNYDLSQLIADATVGKIKPRFDLKKRLVYKYSEIQVERLVDESPDVSWLEQAGFEGERDRYLRNEFHFIGIQAYVLTPAGSKFVSPGLWGIESDSKPDYLTTIEEEEKDALAQLIHESDDYILIPG